MAVYVVAVIKRNDKVFATQRGYGEFKGGWEFPGGKIEPGEGAKEALKREIREELNTDIEVGDLIDVIEHDEAKWLGKEELSCLSWLPADMELLDKIRREL